MGEKDDFDILNTISENITLVQLIELLVNGNHANSIVGCWIFYSSYEQSLCKKRDHHI